jgi:hypothetical protein
METNLIDSKKTIQRLLIAEILYVPANAISLRLYNLLNINSRGGYRIY